MPCRTCVELEEALLSAREPSPPANQARPLTSWDSTQPAYAIVFTRSKNIYSDQS